MSFGYTCDWCRRQGESKSIDQRDLNPLPKGWAKIHYNEHVCSSCLRKGKDAAQGKNITYRGGSDRPTDEQVTRAIRDR